jgi:predicted outer membrane repeat protein
MSVAAVVAGPPAATLAAGTGCSVRNTTHPARFGSMKKAVTAAMAGDRLELRGRCAGPITIDKSLTIVGVKTSATGTPTLTGSDLTRVLFITESVTVRLSRLVIRDGFLPPGAYPGNSGAAILLEGSAVLTGVAVRHNVASDDSGGSGGIEILGTGRLTIAGASVLTGNSGGWGGAIESYGRLLVKGSTRIHHNQATMGGGAIFAGGAITVIRGRARVDQNTAPNGGGIYFDLDGGTLTLADGASVDNNSATVGDGGGIQHENGTLVGAACGVRVHDNTPVDIAPDCL